MSGDTTPTLSTSHAKRTRPIIKVFRTKCKTRGTFSYIFSRNSSRAYCKLRDNLKINFCPSSVRFLSFKDALFTICQPHDPPTFMFEKCSRSSPMSHNFVFSVFKVYPVTVAHYLSNKKCAEPHKASFQKITKWIESTEQPQE